MQTGGENVGTDKKRISTYIDEEKSKEIERLADEAGISVSNWIERAIDIKLSQKFVNVDFDPAILKKLKAYANKGFRSIEDQIKMAVSEWMASKERK